MMMLSLILINRLIFLSFMVLSLNVVEATEPYDITPYEGKSKQELYQLMRVDE